MFHKKFFFHFSLLIFWCCSRWSVMLHVASVTVHDFWMLHESSSFLAPVELAPSRLLLLLWKLSLFCWPMSRIRESLHLKHIQCNHRIPPHHYKPAPHPAATRTRGMPSTQCSQPPHHYRHVPALAHTITPLPHRCWVHVRVEVVWSAPSPHSHPAAEST